MMTVQMTDQIGGGEAEGIAYLEHVSVSLLCVTDCGTSIARRKAVLDTMNLDGLPSHTPDRRDDAVQRRRTPEGRPRAQASGEAHSADNPFRKAAEENFLRFCSRASRRKPVICRPWQIPLDVYVSPAFSTLRRVTGESFPSTAGDACDEALFVRAGTQSKDAPNEDASVAFLVFNHLATSHNRRSQKKPGRRPDH
jgi:hypothetical protein